MAGKIEQGKKIVTIVCSHGRLARSCAQCEAAAEIARLKTDVESGQRHAMFLNARFDAETSALRAELANARIEIRHLRDTTISTLGDPALRTVAGVQAENKRLTAEVARVDEEYHSLCLTAWQWFDERKVIEAERDTLRTRCDELKAEVRRLREAVMEHTMNAAKQIAGGYRLTCAGCEALGWHQYAQVFPTADSSQFIHAPQCVLAGKERSA